MSPKTKFINYNVYSNLYIVGPAQNISRAKQEIKALIPSRYLKELVDMDETDEDENIEHHSEPLVEPTCQSASTTERCVRNIVSGQQFFL